MGTFRSSSRARRARTPEVLGALVLLLVSGAALTVACGEILDPSNGTETPPNLDADTSIEGGASDVADAGVGGDTSLLDGAIPITCSDASTRHVLGLYRPSTRTFFLDLQPDASAAPITATLNVPNTITTDLRPVSGDWTGDGKGGIGVYSVTSHTFYLRDSPTSGAADRQIGWPPNPTPNDYYWFPIVGRWTAQCRAQDHVGACNTNLTRPLCILDVGNGAAPLQFEYGVQNDQFLAGDWNGDRIDTIGVFRASSGMFFLNDSNSAGSGALTTWVDATSLVKLPFAGDFLDKGSALLASFDPPNIKLSVRYPDGVIQSFFAGLSEDLPVAGKLPR